MKKSILIAATAFALISCGEGGEEVVENDQITTDMVAKQTSIEFPNEVYEFGEISQGEKVEHSFTFKNTGDNPLLITEAKGSCGCTVPQWPKEPIAPGQEGTIDVVFDSNGKQGKQNVTVTVVANTVPNVSILALKGDVLVPEE